MRHALPFLSALLLYVSFQPVDFGFLGWVALVPLAVWAARERSGRRVFLVAWAAGTLYGTALVSWLHYTSPWVGPVGAGIFVGFYFAAFAWIIRLACAREGRPRVPLFVAVPVAWVALEFVRASLFGGLPFFLLGYAAHRLDALIQIADLGGVWLVSAVMALVNGALAAAFLEDPRLVRRGAIAAGATVGACLAYGAVRPATIPITDTGPRIAIVQANIPQDIKTLAVMNSQEHRAKIYGKHVDLTRSVMKQNPNLIVWPETALLDDLYVEDGVWYRDTVYDRTRGPALENRVAFVTGVIVRDAPKGKLRDEDACRFTNSAVYFGPDGEVRGRFDKIRLVQFSEYLPFGDVLPTGRLVAWFLKVPRLQEFTHGTEYPVFEHEKGLFAVTICSENYYPEISREFARKGAKTIVNISNDGWFRESAELDAQFVMARFRAIENRVLYVRATNTGISALIDPLGRATVLKGPGGRTKGVEGTLVANGLVTTAGAPWRKLGAWVVWLACGLTAGGVAALWVARRSSGNVDSRNPAE